MKKGIGITSGMAMNKAFILQKPTMNIEMKSSISGEKEIKRYEKAIEKFIKNTKELKANILKYMGQSEANILEGHIQIISDLEIRKSVFNMLEKEKVSAEYAVKVTLENLCALFISLGDEVMRQRICDIQDIKNQVLEILTEESSIGIESIGTPCILVTEELTPSDVGKINKDYIQGIIVEMDSYAGHAAIMLKAIGIPIVLGVVNVMNYVSNQDYLIVNGEDGTILINPDNRQREEYIVEKKAQVKKKEELITYKSKETITKDGQRIQVFANVSSVKEVGKVLEYKVDGIGLFRTEFLFMEQGELPTEEEQFIVYKRIAKQMEEKPVVFRTLDIGGDKTIPGLILDKEDNPFLGLRGIRWSLKEKNMFLTQIRALLRASRFGNIKIMLPLISTLEEVKEAKEIIGKVKEQFRIKNIAFSDKVEVGIMVETPSAALMIDKLVAYVDFISIGTNDLIQYTLAAERSNKNVSHLYTPFQPAVIYLINYIIKTVRKNKIPVCICGEMAGDPLFVPFLLGSGLEDFSVAVCDILQVKKKICCTDQIQAKSKIPELLRQETMEEVKAKLKQLHEVK